MTNKKTITILLLLCLYITSCKTTQEKMVKQDFNQLVSSIKRIHPKSLTDKDKLMKLVDEKRANLKEMSDYELLRYLSPIVAAIDCGHASIDYSEEDKKEIIFNSNFSPLDIKVANNELFVYRDYSTSKVPKGSKILSINGLKSEELLETLYSSMPSDGINKTFKTRELNYNFGNSYYKYIDSPDEFIFELLTPDSKEIITKTITSRTKAIDNRRWKKNKNRFKKNYAILELGTFNFYSEVELEYFYNSMEIFFKKLKEKEINNLIIDFRGNYGGSPEAGNNLLSYILENPFQYFAKGTPFYNELKKDTQIQSNSFSGNLYIIIDGGCFSTTGHVLSHLKDKKRGIIIGEESGGSFICNDSTKPITLKNSGLVLNLPRISFKTSVTSLSLGEGIKPDIEINYTINDYLGKKDLEMDYILKNYIDL